MSPDKTREDHRLFVALWPADDLRAELVRVTRDYAAASGGRLVPAENLHITLAFLGSIGESRLEAIKQVMGRVAVEPFELLFGKIAWWEPQRLLCLEPEAGHDRIGALVEKLRTSLRESGFEVETRIFRPHVTLAREVTRECRVGSTEPIRWPVQRIELIDSKPGKAGSRYSIVPVG
jgi:2'-5' RNA ligase